MPGGERNAANQHAAARHALEHIERRKPPSHHAQLAIAQPPVLHQKNNAEHERNRERRIRQDVQRDVKSEERPLRRRRFDRPRLGQVREQKHAQDDRQHEWADRAAPVNRLEAKIGSGEQPRKKRKRTEKIIVRHGMNQSRPGQQRQVVKAQPHHQARSRANPCRTRRLAQIPDVQRKARRVKKKRRDYVRTCHRLHASAGRVFVPARRKCPLPQHYSQFPKHESTNTRRAVPSLLWT